jgi:hypothetical protein
VGFAFSQPVDASIIAMCVHFRTMQEEEMERACPVNDFS